MKRALLLLTLCFALLLLGFNCSEKAQDSGQKAPPVPPTLYGICEEMEKGATTERLQQLAEAAVEQDACELMLFDISLRTYLAQEVAKEPDILTPYYLRKKSEGPPYYGHQYDERKLKEFIQEQEAFQRIMKLISSAKIKVPNEYFTKKDTMIARVRTIAPKAFHRILYTVEWPVNQATLIVGAGGSPLPVPPPDRPVVFKAYARIAEHPPRDSIGPSCLVPKALFGDSEKERTEKMAAFDASFSSRFLQ